MKTFFSVLLVLAVARLTAGTVRCDDSHECPKWYTCCHLDTGGWGCCPLPQAVCCEDLEHCCPHGYTCDIIGSMCLKGNTSVPLLKKTSPTITPHSSPLGLEPEKLEVLWCDASSHCPSGETCCRLASGVWGCCPVPQAVCCADKEHCCPNGYACELSAGMCIRGCIAMPWLETRPASVTAQRQQEPENVEFVMCDFTHVCFSGTTCCRLASGEWGCCPVPQAVCCPDHVHCCPNGYTCTSSGMCMMGSITLPWLEKTPALSRP